MKRVLLIGDSIRKGYDKSVQETLKGAAEVYFPEENCRFASYILRYFNDYMALVPEGNADVIHWNAGLWDCLHMFGEEPFAPIEIYTYYIDRICARIKTQFPNAKVIFATSTSVQSEKMSDTFKRYNEEIEAYNAAAISVVTKYGFSVNDLYAVSTMLPEEAHSDAVHYYTPVGTEAFTKEVVQKICSIADLPIPAAYQEKLYEDEPIGI